MEEDLAGVVQRYFFEIWNEGRLEALPEVLCEHCVLHDKLLGDLAGLVAMRELILRLKARWPGIRHTVHALVADGDKVAVQYSVGDFGRPTVDGMALFRFESNRIVEISTVRDDLSWFQLHGLAQGILGPLPIRRSEAAADPE